MHFILEPIFNLFGKRAIGQLVGGTVIGAILPALTILRNGERPPGGILGWTVGGAVAGFVGGLFLLSPKRFFGSIFTILGLVIIAVRMSRADGLPVGLQAHLIKLSVGVVLFSLGVLLLVRAWRRLRS
jgi:hypothetical protein